MATKKRLDILLVERGLAESPTLAQRLLMAGQVRVDGEVELRAALKVSPDVHLKVEPGLRYASRGGEKLAAALQDFQVDTQGCVCADVGASTGGFTDCLLQHGAAKVFAIDVGRGILDWKLRQDSRVVVMEGTNARFLKQLPEAVELVTVDASFISLKLLLPFVKGWFFQKKHAGKDVKGTVIALIKPQFEADRQQVGRGKGVIRDSAIHRQVLMGVLSFSVQEGYRVRGLIRSPLTGPKGNAEFLTWLEYPGEQTEALEDLVEAVFPGSSR